MQDSNIQYMPPITDLITKSEKVVQLAKKMSSAFRKTEEGWTDYIGMAIMAGLADAMKEAYKLGAEATL